MLRRIGKYPELSLRNYWKNLKAEETRGGRRFIVGDFLPLDHPAGIMEVVNRIRHADRMQRIGYCVENVPDFKGYAPDETSLANQPLTSEALVKRALSLRGMPASVRLHFPGHGVNLQPVENFLAYLFKIHPGFSAAAKVVLSDYVSLPIDPLLRKFPLLGNLKNEGRLAIDGMDFRHPPEGFFQGPTWIVAVYLFDSFPAKLVRKEKGKFYEILYRLALPYDIPNFGGDCYDSCEQREAIAGLIERTRNEGRAFPWLPKEICYETLKQEIPNLKEFPFGNAIEAVTEGLDNATFHINNQALESILLLARLLERQPWLVQILGMAKPGRDSLATIDYSILGKGEDQCCWVDLTAPLWNEVLKRRGLHFSVQHFRDFTEAALGYKVCPIESLLDNGVREYFNDKFLPVEYVNYLQRCAPGALDYMRDRLGQAVARVFRKGERFLTAHGNEELNRALEEALEVYPHKPDLMGYLRANLDKIWELDTFHFKFGREEGVNLYYLEISNQVREA